MTELQRLVAAAWEAQAEENEQKARDKTNWGGGFSPEYLAKCCRENAARAREDAAYAEQEGCSYAVQYMALMGGAASEKVAAAWNAVVEAVKRQKRP